MIRGGVGVVFLPAPNPQLVVAGVDQDTIDRVQTQFSGEKLTVDCPGMAINVGSGANININGGTVSIGGITIGGGDHGNCIVALAQPTAPRIQIQGSGDATLYEIEQSDLDLAVQGSGDIVVHGQAGYLDAHVMGSGDVDTEELSAGEACLTVSGSGDIRARVVERVHVQVNGSGDIVVYGNPPDRREAVRGSGGIRFKSL